MKLAIIFAALLAAAPVFGANILLTKSNTVALSEEVDGTSVSEVIATVSKLNKLKTDAPIYLYLRTPGGSVQAGLEMYEALRGSRRPIHTITMFAASMGFQTVQQLGRRYVFQNGVLMSHHAAGAVEGEIGGSAPSQMDNRKSFWESRILEMDQQTVNRTNGKQTMASYHKAYENELWLTGRQAVNQGYADELATASCDPSLNGTVKRTANLGFFSVVYDISDCPLDSEPKNVRIGRILTDRGENVDSDTFAKVGGFGATCYALLRYEPKRTCAMDPSLSWEKLDQAKAQIVDKYRNIKGWTRDTLKKYEGK